MLRAGRSKDKDVIISRLGGVDKTVMLIHRPTVSISTPSKPVRVAWKLLWSVMGLRSSLDVPRINFIWSESENSTKSRNTHKQICIARFPISSFPREIVLIQRSNGLFSNLIDYLGDLINHLQKKKKKKK